jgi:hemoglobin-like flavoprotein
MSTAAAKDPMQIAQETWAVLKTKPGVAEHFYNTLFELKPEYRTTLFRNAKIKTQAVMLTSMLDVCVTHVRDPSILVPNLRDLGLRHCRYGCRLEDYELGGKAFIMTLEHFFGDALTPEIRMAWTWVYGVVQAVMVSTNETEEGKRLLAEYDARLSGKPVPAPARAPAAKDAPSPNNNTWQLVAVASVCVAAGAVASALMR